MCVSSEEIKMLLLFGPREIARVIDPNIICYPYREKGFLDSESVAFLLGNTHTHHTHTYMHSLVTFFSFTIFGYSVGSPLPDVCEITHWLGQYVYVLTWQGILARRLRSMCQSVRVRVTDTKRERRRERRLGNKSTSKWGHNLQRNLIKKFPLAVVFSFICFSCPTYLNSV